ncbi:MAG: hypothetical protein RIE73_07035 [Coleofasciculus sp. C1-SOL-03]|jgi:hypothetical protein|uniref:hypothetical protein n=1 Tax=Coleofasciculus sp. C1-SOL-03 TaxID=3069522 RepID=UPI0032F8E9E4
MWNIIFIGLILFYLVMLPLFFTRWLGFLKREENLSAKAQFHSLMFLLLAAILWPLVVPISYLELLERQKQLQNF